MPANAFKSLPLPDGAATEATLSGLTTGLQNQTLDSNNSKTITSADASPGSAWVGTASQTRSQGVVGIYLSVISSAALAGTYTFEFGEDGSTWPISIAVAVDDFSTIRYRQLLNVGEYFRAKFEPTLALGANTVTMTTQFSKQADPPFVVATGHVYEEDDAAFGSNWSFLRAFDSNGLSKNLKCNPTGELINADFLIEVAKGNVTGHSLIGLSGHNADIDSGAAETVWEQGGVFTPPTSSGTCSVVSSSTDDDAAGTGAREVTIVGLDASGDDQTEAIATDGTNAVVTSGSWSAINEAYVSDVGSGLVNAGIITGTVSSTVMFGIPVDSNNSALGFITIPNAKTAYALDYNVSQSNATSSSLYAYLMIKELNEPIRRRKHFGGHSQGGNVVGSFMGTLVIPGRSFIRWDANVSANNNDVSATANFLLVDD